MIFKINFSVQQFISKKYVLILSHSLASLELPGPTFYNSARLAISYLEVFRSIYSQNGAKRFCNIIFTMVVNECVHYLVYLNRQHIRMICFVHR